VEATARAGQAVCAAVWSELTERTSFVIWRRRTIVVRRWRLSVVCVERPSSVVVDLFGEDVLVAVHDLNHMAHVERRLRKAYT
jgi:hypothetical protein